MGVVNEEHLKDLENRIKDGHGRLKMKSGRRTYKPSYYKPAETAKERSPKKGQRKVHKRRQAAKKHALDDDSGDDDPVSKLKSKHVTRKKAFGARERYERDEIQRSGRFVIEEDSGSRDESGEPGEDAGNGRKGLEALLKDANDHELNDGEAIVKKLSEGRSNLEAIRFQEKRDKKDDCRARMKKDRKERATKNQAFNLQNSERTASISDANNVNSNNTYNININHSGGGDASFAGLPMLPQFQVQNHVAGPQFPHQNHMAAPPMLPQFPFQNHVAGPQFPVQNPMAMIQNMLACQQDAHCTEMLYSTFRSQCVGPQNDRWLEKFQRALDIQTRSGGIVRGGYLACDDTLASWIAYQRRNKSRLELIKQQLLSLLHE